MRRPPVFNLCGLLFLEQMLLVVCFYSCLLSLSDTQTPWLNEDILLLRHFVSRTR
jgi:hypothetical protein